MSQRRQYKVVVEFIATVDDEPLPNVERLVAEHVNEMLYRMERDDIRIDLLQGVKVKEL